MKFLYGVILIALFLTVMTATLSEARCGPCFTTDPQTQAKCSECCGRKGGVCKGPQCICGIQY
uniref:Lepidopteran-selective toxin n=1 Tax=Hottentotta tamulus TaxID=34647 RepID=CTXL_HOTTA|nr:RecName: Full=Lepidopteran-selective toxin; AltName: Full=BTChl2; AltName: Full=ButaIT; Flags: Precursor [Mesobuthus tamulus]AAL87237.1 BTChl2 [Mesobuthus tamulus]